MPKTKTGNVFNNECVSLDLRYQEAEGNWPPTNNRSCSCKVH